MDGYTLCRKWRADEQLCGIPFIFYTATFTGQQDEALALNVGADRFVIKPQEPDAFMEIIRQVLSSSRQAAPVAEGTVADENDLLKEYSESLFRKLEKKMADLEKANLQLAESENYFRRFIMECPIAIAVSDPQDNIKLLNERFVATFGYTQEDIPTVDAWWRSAYPDPAYRTHVCQIWQDAMKRSQGIVHAAEEYMVTGKDGTPHFVHIYAAPVSSMLVVVFNDVTERKQAEKEHQELQSQMILQDKMASLGQLAAGIVHEINNPIGFVRSNLQSLAKHANRLKNYIDAVDRLVLEDSSSAAAEILAGERHKLKIDFALEDIGSILQDCSEGTERIVQIVKNLKEFAHDDKVEVQQIDLNSCCDIIVRIVWNEIKYVATLKREYGDIPLVTCNSQQISQVIMNLMVNAAQAIDEQGEITLRTWADGDSVFFSVSDTGSGIAPENLNKIFEAFFTTKTVGKGTGLGLSISAGIIRKHGGEITVSSEVDKGTCFVVRLPVTRLEQ
jgi:PAS domain S-box-containing protein